MNRIITPECCEDIKFYGNIFLSLNVYGGDSSKEKPRWHIKQLNADTLYDMHPELEVYNADRSKLYNPPSPKFCPYCSTALPEIKPRETTEKICKVTDGGYYCDTCDERLNCCSCRPPEYAWEVVK